MSDSPRIVLTGASRGLGLSLLGLLLTKHNARVATLSRSYPPELQAVEKEFGEERVIALQGDVAEQGDNERVVQASVERWGGVDGVILNAGVLEPFGKLSDLPASTFSQYFQSNLLSMLYLLQPALPHLRKSGGRVVFVSSGASQKGYQGWGLYSAAKAAGNSLVRTLAAEEKEAGVGVWAVRPGVMDTDMQALIRQEGPGRMDPKDSERFQALHDNGELLAPERPGSVIAGLAVSGPLDLSGEYLDWADERLSHLRLDTTNT